jgi:hypothetical protein
MNLISYLQVEQDPSISSLSGNLNSSGQYLLSLIPVINGITGGNIELSGVSPISVFVNGDTVIISGNFSNFITTSLTGQFQPSGNYYSSNNPSSFASITVSGSNKVAGTVNFSGIGGTQVILSGQNILISGSGTVGGSSPIEWNFTTSDMSAPINSYIAPIPSSPLTIALPTGANVVDGVFVTVVDFFGPALGFGFNNYPTTVSGGANQIYQPDGTQVANQILNRNFQIQTYVYSALAGSWIANSQFYQTATSGVLSSGTCTINHSAISATSHFSLSHFCTSTGNFGALYVSNINLGAFPYPSATISSTNPNDNDTISIIFQ